MRFGIAGPALAFWALTLTGYPALAAPSPTDSAARAAPNVRPPLVPADFKVPHSAEAEGFKLVPLGPSLVGMDFDAYMSSIEHLQKTFSRSPNWPHKGISSVDALRDMENEEARFKSRQSFAYAVLTPDGSRERGCVYIAPSAVNGYDAVVRMWVTKADYDAGFDAELYKWVTDWIQTAWPFKTVAYPGRAVDWATWDALVAANKAASKTETP